MPTPGFPEYIWGADGSAIRKMLMKLVATPLAARRGHNPPRYPGKQRGLELPHVGVRGIPRIRWGFAVQ